MTQLTTPAAPVATQPRSNVYTVMLIVVFLLLAVAVGYVWVRHNDLFGGGNPFDPSPGTATVERR